MSTEPPDGRLNRLLKAVGPFITTAEGFRRQSALQRARLTPPGGNPLKVFELHPEDGFHALQVVDRARPEIASGSVRVRVRAVSLNYRDLMVARGSKKRARRIVPVSDGAGEVIEVGSGVQRLAIGDRVAAAFFPTWLDGPFAEEHHANALGGSLDGMLAEEVVLPERAWVRIPTSYTFEQASTLPCAGVTAWHALFEAATVKPAATVLVQGGGGVSTFALQLARAAGATVIATSSSADKRSRLEKMGAATTIDYTADSRWGETARAAAASGGVDLVVEVGGAGTFDQSVASLRYGGHMSLLGILAGTQGPVNTYAVFHKNIHIRGVYVGSVAMFERLVHVLERSSVKPVIDRVFPFHETRAAYDYLASGAHFGKVVIKVD